MLPLGQKGIEKEKWSKRHEDIRLILRHLLEPLNKITKVPNLLSFCDSVSSRRLLLTRGLLAHERLARSTVVSGQGSTGCS